MIVENIVEPVHDLVKRGPSMPDWLEGIITGALAMLPIGIAKAIISYATEVAPNDVKGFLQVILGGIDAALGIDAYTPFDRSTGADKWAYGWFSFWEMLGGASRVASGVVTAITDEPALEVKAYNLIRPKLASIGLELPQLSCLTCSPEITTLLYPVNPTEAALF